MVTGKTSRIPSFEFRYSWVYDKENMLRYTDPMYPSGEDIREYISEIKPLWRPRQRTMLRAISRLSGLIWKEDTIICYVVGRGVPLPDPLVMPVYESNADIFIERMSYQLVQRLMMHPKNLAERSSFWEAMFRDFGSDGVKVSYMVPVNAVFRELQSRYFSSDGSGQSLLSTNLDHRRAWEIVDSLGHKNIIERFRRGEWE